MTSGRRLHDPLLGNERVADLFSSRTQLQLMLDVEAALADAEAAVGVIPVGCVELIRSAARAELYDHGAIAAETAAAGNVAIPVVRHLTRRVAASDGDAARYVHWGATSQDISDTALVLQLQTAVPLVIEQIERAGGTAADLARRYAETPMAGRTWLQQATPTTFGLKAAGWLDALDRSRARLIAALDDVRVLQFGGAAGTLASLGPHGPAVTDALAARLDLRAPDIPWHAQRDRLSHLACSLGVNTGICGKIARDLSLLAQTEIGEAAESRRVGGGGSSTMPQKRNPVASSVALAAAFRAPGLVATILAGMLQEHERGLGGWQAEWDTLPDLVTVAASGAQAIADALAGLDVDPVRMRSNTEAAGGALLAESVAMTLAESVGKSAAHETIEAACRRSAKERVPLVEVLAADPLVTAHMDREEITRRLSPEQYLGAAATFITRVLARHDEAQG